MNILRLESCRSTNAELAAIAVTAPDRTVVTTRCQTAGRGQRGNSWESAPGQNLTLSVLLRPQRIAARDAFIVSAEVANAVYETVRALRPDADVAVKWPNDIYIGDGKLAGILIENVLEGSRIGRSIVGIGLNVLQDRFESDAPNPVSLGPVEGYDLDAIEELLCRNLFDCVEAADDPAKFGEVMARYNSRLYRRDGRLYPFREPDGEVFEASVAGALPSGHLRLIDAAGMERIYAFKEVEHVLPTRKR